MRTTIKRIKQALASFTIGTTDPLPNAASADPGGSGEVSDKEHVHAVHAVWILKDVKPQNIDGGSSTSITWVDRDLNTEEGSIIGASLLSNEITLQSGTYLISCSAPSYICNRHMLRLYNVSDSSIGLLGSSEFVGPASSVQSLSLLNGIITISSEKSFKVQHYVQTGVVSNGFGIATNIAGTTELYTQLKITRLY